MDSDFAGFVRCGWIVHADTLCLEMVVVGLVGWRLRVGLLDFIAAVFKGGWVDWL